MNVTMKISLFDIKRMLLILQWYEKIKLKIIVWLVNKIPYKIIKYVDIAGQPHKKNLNSLNCEYFIYIQYDAL